MPIKKELKTYWPDIEMINVRLTLVVLLLVSIVKLHAVSKLHVWTLISDPNSLLLLISNSGSSGLAQVTTITAGHTVGPVV